MPPHNPSKKVEKLGIIYCKFESQKHYRQSLGRIKGLSKGLSRKGEGSQNWCKNTRKLAKAHYRVACQRQELLHKITNYLSRNYALIGLEDLNYEGDAC
jgi:putative transposase